MSSKFNDDADEDIFGGGRRRSEFVKRGKEVISSRSRDFSQDDFDSDEDIDERNRFAYPDLDNKNKRNVNSNYSDSDEDSDAGGKVSEGKVQEGKTAEKKVLPPPRVGPPPKGLKPSRSAAHMVRSKIAGMAPPKGPPPSSGRSAGGNARARLRAKMAQSGRKPPAPGKGRTSRFAMDKQTIDVSNKLAGNVTSVHDQLRKEGLNKLDGSDLDGGSKIGDVDDSNSRDRIVEDSGLSSHPLGGVGDVFSHEWEVQTDHQKKRNDSHRSARRARDGARYEQPKSRSIKRGGGRKQPSSTSYNGGDVLSDDDGDNVDENAIRINGEGKERDANNLHRSRGGPSTISLRGDRGTFRPNDDRLDSDHEEDLEQEVLNERRDMKHKGYNDDYSDDERMFNQSKGSPLPVGRDTMRKMRNEGDDDVSPRLSRNKEGTKTNGHHSRREDDGEMDDTDFNRASRNDADYDDAENISDSSPKMNDGVQSMVGPPSPFDEEESDDGVSPIQIYDQKFVPKDPDALKDWVMRPPQNGEDQFVQCIIKRKKGGLLKKTTYEFYLEQDNRLLMVAQKIRATSVNVAIALNESDFHADHQKRGKYYLGKLKSTKDTREYTIYDRGLNPVDVMNASYREFSQSGNREDLIRREMGCITFQRGKETAADRRMEVCIPSIIATADGLEHTVEWVPTNDEDTMSSWFARIRFKGAQNILYRERMMCMHNRKWSSGKTSILEEFMNRAHTCSAKNFQLVVSRPEDQFMRVKYMQSPLGSIDIDDVRNVLVQMGKISNDTFAVDFQYPVPAFTAFAICLSRFVTKQND